MKARLWGTRGSVPTPGPATARYGGNTSCVEVVTGPTHRVVLDAGTGIRGLGSALPTDVARVDILLSHLHMDHIIGLGFFRPLYRPDLEVHIWGPSSTTLDLRGRLSRFRHMGQFYADARDGRLPAYSFIEPRFFFNENDAHPPSFVYDGKTLPSSTLAAPAQSFSWISAALASYSASGRIFEVGAACAIRRK